VVLVALDATAQDTAATPSTLAADVTQVNVAPISQITIAAQCVEPIWKADRHLSLADVMIAKWACPCSAAMLPTGSLA
jgi:hypothetical protein